MIAADKFARARSTVLAKRAAYDQIRVALSVKYGSTCNAVHYGKGERAKLERASAAYDKACDRIFTLLQDSPRDWRSSVPVAWVAETLSYADAVRPTTDQLSVTPPCSFGNTIPLR
jgi:hypothetical protein